jgi:hypothetical protein
MSLSLKKTYFNNIMFSLILSTQAIGSSLSRLLIHLHNITIANFSGYSRQADIKEAILADLLSVFFHPKTTINY